MDFTTQLNCSVATAAILTYIATLYPGIARSLLSKKFQYRWLMRTRQRIGLSSCALGLCHALLSLHKVQFSMPQFHLYTSGFLPLSILLLLSCTSNHFAQKQLGKFWKTLHKLTYLLPAILIWHVTARMAQWSYLTGLNLILLGGAASLLSM